MLATIATMAMLAVGVAAAAAAVTPHVGTYGGTSTAGHHVQFDIDTHTVHGFTLGGIQVFSNAQIDHATATFQSHTEHYRVHGTWTSSTEVHGGICNLHVSPTGCHDGSGHQGYTVTLKTKQRPAG